MKLIKPLFKILSQSEGIDGIYKQIELAGRTCYRSHDKMTEDSAKDFVDRMIKSGHGAMLEHGTVYLKVVHDIQEGVDMGDPYEITLDLVLNPYSKVVSTHDHYVSYITTNLRVLVERYPNDWKSILEYYFCEPTGHHEKRVTVEFTTDQGILREFTRHRTLSFAVESTRYCNYSKDKFNNEVTFIIPSWLDWEEQVIHKGDFEKSGSGSEDSSVFINALLDAEQDYFKLLKEGWKPQQARNVLPLATKCELIMTGFVSDWSHFFSLRASEAGAKGMHPQADELASPLYLEFKSKGYLE